MPQIGNIVVKKADGATDVTYTAVVPSGGDKSPAMYRSLSVGTAHAQRPTFRIQSSSNGTGTARRVEGNLVYPSVVTGTDGTSTITDRGQFSFSAVIPQNMKDQDVWEFVYQATGILANIQVRDTLVSGYAPT